MVDGWLQRLLTSVLLSPILLCTPSYGVEKPANVAREEALSDVPWDEIDRILKDEQKVTAPAKPSQGPDRAGKLVKNTADNDTSPVKKAQADARPADSAQQPYDGPEDPSDSHLLRNGGETADEKTDDEQQTVLPAPPRVPPDFTLELTDAITSARLPSSPRMTKEEREAVKAFYEARLNEPLWAKRDGLNSSGEQLMKVISNASNWGLDARQFQISLPLTGIDGDVDDETLIASELQLTAIALKYVKHSEGGRITNPTKQLSSYLDRKPRLTPTAKVLVQLAEADDKRASLVSHHPKHDQFLKLKKKLAELRGERGKKEVILVPTRGPLIKVGQSHEEIGLIRQKLKVATPEAKRDGSPADEFYYDRALAKAVVQYKQQHGIKPTTNITNQLRRTLNSGGRTVSEDDIIANMEQWRWMPKELGDVHITVNIPEFTVRLNKNGKTVHAERVVTGKPHMQTPVFSHKMSSVVFQPVWNVPQSIAVNELLPGLRDGRNMLARRGLVAKRNGRYIDPWSIDWYSTDIRKFHIYQPPGPGNALGIVKFLFPNKHAVYLHDTPSKRLFNSASRAFSHGCIRVRNPVRLAELIMEHDRGWDAKQVRRKLRRGPENNQVKLEKAIPVHITYFTVAVNDAGELVTFRDVYGHEKRIEHALAGRWDRIAKHEDHLKPVKVQPAGDRRQAYYIDEWGYRRPVPGGQYADDYAYDDRRYGSRRRPYRNAPSIFDQIFGGY